jgi:hypothetical protein
MGTESESELSELSGEPIEEPAQEPIEDPADELSEEFKLTYVTTRRAWAEQVASMDKAKEGKSKQ